MLLLLCLERPYQTDSECVTFLLIDVAEYECQQWWYSRRHSILILTEFDEEDIRLHVNYHWPCDSV